ncbi:MAG TPA: 4'-phosphopantetheinyl transferase superfamily protein [Candidatus Baltobacteraceae bacterium]|nr:4'-phosphopantetheinyl transferase superfamily protein [Candidatus Baltobacteraceae bacterium]
MQVRDDDGVAGQIDPQSREVHVWRVNLGESSDRCAIFDRYLSVDERARRERFRSELIGRRWAEARGALRVVLGSYASVAPSRIVFDTGQFGKPVLRESNVALSFNITHTGNIALIAVAGTNRMVGIDAELIRSDVEWSNLSRRFFAPAEAEEIHSAPPEQHVAAFFACWTRKEALVKAMGVGLSMLLDTFQVSMLPNRPAEVIAVAGDPLARTRWKLVDLSEADFAAALAVNIPDPIMRRFSFEDVLQEGLKRVGA